MHKVWFEEVWQTEKQQQYNRNKVHSYDTFTPKQLLRTYNMEMI